MISDIELARRRFGPSLADMRSSLPDMGESLNTACHDLAMDLSLDRVDELLNRFKAGTQNLIHLRQSMIYEQTKGHGTG